MVSGCIGQKRQVARTQRDMDQADMRLSGEPLQIKLSRRGKCLLVRRCTLMCVGASLICALVLDQPHLHLTGAQQVPTGDQLGFVEHQLAQALAQLTGSGASNSAQSAPSQQYQLPGSISPVEPAGSGGSSRSRSPRSIGEMFKKFFNGNKRSKAVGQAGSSASGSPGQAAPSAAAAAAVAAARDWEQQQALQHQQYQQSQANMAAAQMAVAAANQHAVYASPFAAYTPPSGAATPMYPQFATAAYSPGNLMAWPASTGPSGYGRGPPTTLLSPSVMGGPASGSGPLYAAASQSYHSYAAPPPGPGPGSASAAAGPQPAASHAHPSAVAPPPGANTPANNALDFHQVLDAFVRTSGFAPAGDQEAAAAQGYGAKAADGGMPVFSFKKLVSLPFYLSTEEKQLDGLAGAMAPSGSPGGYSIHSIPIMRRHVRRMSATPAQHQLHQGNAEHQSERAHQQLYNNYANAFNNQLASMSANNQIIQYLQQQQKQQQQQLDAFNSASMNEAMASFQQPLAQKPARSGSPDASSLSMAGSVLAPTAVQPPVSTHQASLVPSSSSMSAFQQQLRQTSADQQQQQDLQSLLNGYQSQLANSVDLQGYQNALMAGSSGFVPSQILGDRYGNAQAPASRYTYPMLPSSFEPMSGSPLSQVTSGMKSSQKVSNEALGANKPASQEGQPSAEQDQQAAGSQQVVSNQQQPQLISAGVGSNNSSNYAQHLAEPAQKA